MNKIFIYLLLLCCLEAHAQQTATAAEAANLLIANYNSNQFQAIYHQLSPSVQKLVTEQQFIDFYQIKLKVPLGKIISSALQNQTDNNQIYQVTFERGSQLLKIGTEKGGDINYHLWLPARNTALISTNNRRSKAIELLVDSLARDYLRNPHTSSLSIGLINGNHTETYFYGETKRGTNKLPDSKSIYEIASVSKTFTAILLSHAVKARKIGLSDDIRKYLPGNYPGLQFNELPITILQLANHTSGIPGLPDDFFTRRGYQEADPYSGYTKEMIYHFLKTYKPLAVSGKVYSYSNLGVVLLGIILENIYHQPLQTLLEEVITTPLKMKYTSYELPARHRDLMTTGYHEESGAVSSWNLEEFRAAGGLKSNLKDMLLYLKANMDDCDEDYKLSKQQTFAAPPIGLVWMLSPFKGDTMIWHNGQTGGFRSFCGYIKKKKMGVVILSNSDLNADGMASELLKYSVLNPI